VILSSVLTMPFVNLAHVVQLGRLTAQGCCLSNARNISDRRPASSAWEPRCRQTHTHNSVWLCFAHNNLPRPSAVGCLVTVQ
jgi:hypothetical protein